MDSKLKRIKSKLLGVGKAHGIQWKIGRERAEPAALKAPQD